MSQEKIKRVHQIYGIVLSVLIVIVGLCFIVSCVAIYNSGDRPFSRETVSAYFSKIAIPVYVCIAAVVGGIVLQFVLPLKVANAGSAIEAKTALERLHRRLDLDACSGEVLSGIAKERRLRLIARAVCTLLCIACAVPVVLYLFTPGNFSADADRLNSDLFSAMLFTVCFFLDAVIFCVVERILEKMSLQRETALVKSAIAAGARLDEPRDTNSDWYLWGAAVTQILSTTLGALIATVFCATVLRCNGFISADAVTVWMVVSIVGVLLMALCMTLYFVFLWKRPDFDLEKWGILIARILLPVIALVLIVFGILNGGMADVFAKAVRICTECIGLG